MILKVLKVRLPLALNNFSSIAQQIKKLRDITGSSISDCKSAIENSNNDLQKAIEYLNQKGMASADKKSSKVVREGAIGVLVSQDRKQASIIEVQLLRLLGQL
jgi:elongation factor Ts